MFIEESYGIGEKSLATIRTIECLSEEILSYKYVDTSTKFLEGRITRTIEVLGTYDFIRIIENYPPQLALNVDIFFQLIENELFCAVGVMGMRIPFSPELIVGTRLTTHDETALTYICKTYNGCGYEFLNVTEDNNLHELDRKLFYDKNYSGYLIGMMNL